MNRVTAEHVLDEHVLLRFINQNVISEIQGCISTGKEVVWPGLLINIPVFINLWLENVYSNNDFFLKKG